MEPNPPPGVIEVVRTLDEGRETAESRLPAVLTVVKDINIPRLAAISDVRRAVKMPIPTWGAADLPGVDPRMLGLEGSPTRVVKIGSPPGRASAVEMIPADNADRAASELAGKLMAAKVL